MSTIAEFTIEPSEFFLGGLIESIPDLAIELERVVPIGDQLMPYLWCYADDIDAVQASLERQPPIETVRCLDYTEQAALFRIEWDDDTASLARGLYETDATLLEVDADGVWSVRVLFENRGDVRTFHQYLSDNDVQYSLDRMFSAVEDVADPTTALTERQREALELAAREGYFQVPRETSIASIGRSLDISEQATSERLRRGIDALLGETFGFDA